MFSITLLTLKDIGLCDRIR
uniref:Uncharacterized protein n=1 Tax=Moniliophthora roreri TaxID=221103 RepID=A0A0W0G3K5_MONRR